MLSTVIQCAAAAKGVCSVSATLTANPLTLAARTGASLSIPAHAPIATVKWGPSAVADLAGYKLYRGTTPGGPYTVVTDLGFLTPNLLLQSNIFTNAAWTKEGSILNGNAHATDDTLDASELIQTVSTGPHRVSQVVASVPAGTYTASIYLKARAVSLMTVRLFGDNFHSYAAEFDLAQGLITPGSAEAYPGTTALMTPLGDGWYRCSVTGALVAGPAALYAELNNALHSGAYAGDAIGSAFILRAMLKKGLTPAPYIGTTTGALVGTLVTNLTPGLTYYFVATAYDTSLNESDPGAEVSKLIPYSLSTIVRCAAQATGAVSTSVNLRTAGAIFLASSATCKASVAAPLTTSITLRATLSCRCSTAAVLAFSLVGAGMAAVPSVKLTVSAGLITAIRCGGTAGGFAQTIASLRSGSQTLAAIASVKLVVISQLTTAIRVQSHPAGICSTRAALEAPALPPSYLIENVHERGAERGIERGIFGGGG